MISLFIVLVGLYFFNFFSFLNSLLILESLSLILYYMVVIFFFNSFSLSMLMFYFVFIVCESAIGLSILVKSVKFYGLSNFFLTNLFMY